MSPAEVSHLSLEKDILLHTFLEASPIVNCTAHTINLMSAGCQGCVSKCSYDYGCVRLSVSADWRRLIPIRDDCDPCDIIVPDVNHLTTSNQELHPVIDPGPTVRWPRLHSSDRPVHSRQWPTGVVTAVATAATAAVAIAVVIAVVCVVGTSPNGKTANKTEILNVYLDRKTAAKLNGYKSLSALDNPVKKNTITNNHYYMLYKRPLSEFG